MKNEKLKIDQEIYFKPKGNAARYNKDIITAKIKSIGNKYFTIKESSVYMHPSIRFYNDTLQHDNGEYSSNYRGYLSKQDIIDEQERPKLLEQAKTKLNTFTNEELKSFLNFP